MWENSIRHSLFSYSGFFENASWPQSLTFHVILPFFFFVYIFIWFLIIIKAYTWQFWHPYILLTKSFFSKVVSILIYVFSAFKCIYTLLWRKPEPLLNNSFSSEDQEANQKSYVVTTDARGVGTGPSFFPYNDEKTITYVNPNSGTCEQCRTNTQCPMKLWHQLHKGILWLRPFTIFSVLIGIIALAFNIILVILPGNTQPNRNEDDGALKGLIAFAPSWSLMAYFAIQASTAILIASLLKIWKGRIPSGLVSFATAFSLIVHLTAFSILFTIMSAVVAIGEAVPAWFRLNRDNNINLLVTGGIVLWSTVIVLLWIILVSGVTNLIYVTFTMYRLNSNITISHNIESRTLTVTQPSDTAVHLGTATTTIQSPDTSTSWIFNKHKNDDEEEEGCGCSCCSSDKVFHFTKESSERTAGWVSYLTFSWVSPLIALGHARTLQIRDLFLLPSSIDALHLEEDFDMVWKNELKKHKENAQLARAGLVYGRKWLSISAALKIVYDSLNLLGPMLLNLLIKSLTKSHWALYDVGKFNIRTYVGTLLLEGLGIIALMAISNFTQTLLLHQYFRIQFTLGIKLRSAFIAYVYSKSLRASFGAGNKPKDNAENTNKEEAHVNNTVTEQQKKDDNNNNNNNNKEEVTKLRFSSLFSFCLKKRSTASKIITEASTTGEIVNLMSVDAERIVDCMQWIHILWSAPYQIIVALVLLWLQLGPSMLAGFAVMCIGIPLTIKMATTVEKQQRALMKIRDERIKITNEVLTGIKILKEYAWEESFKIKISNIRRQELKRLWKNQLITMCQRILWTCMPTIVSFVSFAAYVGSGHELTAANAFTSIALFNILRFPLNVLPNVISVCTQSWVACTRLQSFFVRPEIQLPPDVPSAPMLSKSTPTVVAQNLTLRWSNKTPLINNLSFTCHPGTLTAVIGRTGAGKSGLLTALIGDLCPEPTTLDGSTVSSLAVTGRIAYVSQTAWIQNATVRENILFGRPYNARWYQKVVRACALRDDLSILPYGDMTEIGEKGVNLSGGQKQRVSLARATYQAGNFPCEGPEELPADIYILDDCLSAVDTHVGQHILNKCILKLLKASNRTIIMATHKIDLLPHADQIIFLVRDSAITSSSSFSMNSRPNSSSTTATTYNHPDAPLSSCPTIQGTNGAAYALAIGTEDVIKHFPEYIAFTQEAERLNEKQDNIEDASVFSEKRSFATSQSVLHKNSKALLDPGVRQQLQPLTLPSPILRPRFNSQHSVTRDDTTTAFDPTVVDLLRVMDSSGSSPHEFDPSLEMSELESVLTRLSKGGDEGPRRNIIEEETAQQGAVSSVVYWAYFEGIGGSPMLLCVILGLALTQASSVAGNFWLSYWSDHAAKVPGLPTGIGVYTGLGCVQILIFSVAAFLFICASQRASHYFHNRLLSRLLRAPTSFFDSTPVGRIINRFSKDLYTIDQVLPSTMNMYIVNLFVVIATFGVIIVALPWFTIVCIPLLILYITIQKYYIPCTRQIQRIDSILRSPLFAHFSETLDGVVTIRAYRAQNRFRQSNTFILNFQQRAYYLLMNCNRWLAVRLESIGTLIVTFAGLLAVFGGLTNTLSPGLGGLAVSYALSITQSLNWMVRMASDRESNIVSVERIEDYSTRVPQEAPLSIQNRQPPLEWPQSGHLVFKGYFLKYRPHLPYVLNNLNFEIQPEQKVGVVGRTGAGKTSLMVGILRIVEPTQGSIELDKIDISKIGLHALRSKLSIIPQDPILFTGTLRFNLDPFETYDDVNLWTALEQAHLKHFVLHEFEGGLLGQVEEGGRNISVGQRQLICLARALLRQSKVLLLDEATSAVDPLTDRLIQETIREAFKKCTVLTVAHRIATVLDYDKILVLDFGKVTEFGPPGELIKKEGGMFRSLCIDGGIL